MAHEFAQPGFSRIHLDPQAHPTNGSWWAEEQGSLTQRAYAELPRMNRSKFGRTETLAAGPMEEAAGSKLARARRAAAGYQSLGLKGI